MRKRMFEVVVLLICIAAVAPPVAGFIIESPKEGETIVIGKPFKWKIRLEQGEVCKTINLMPAQFDSSTGLFEWTEVVKPEDNTLGKQNFFLTGEPLETCDDSNADVTLNVVLPSTTVLTKISAAIGGKGENFMTLYKHDNGNLVQTFYSVDKVTAGGKYSDGVWREITAHPDTTYTSSDEKVLKVTPPGKWMLNDKYPESPRKAKNERPGSGALVTAVGPGKAKIIVRNGSFEDSVIGIVNVKPCSAWKKQAEPDDLPVCD